MRIPREQVLEFLSFVPSDGGGLAENELPAYIDTDKDAGLLTELGVDPTALLGQFNGHHSKA